MRIPPTGIALEEIEKRALIEALKMSNWVQKDAAELLSISPRVINYKIKTLKIEFPRGRRDDDAGRDAGSGVAVASLLAVTAPATRCSSPSGAPAGRPSSAAPR